MDNTQKFDGLADIYDANRPNYPVKAIETILARLPEAFEKRLCLDVGAGTGISTRALARALPDWRIIAIEPNIDMARKACAALEAHPNTLVRQGVAEELPAAAATCGLVCVAQALHWFDRPFFFDESRRVLAPSGILAILNNNRRTAECPALVAVEDFFEAENLDYSRDYRSFDILSELSTIAGFDRFERIVQSWTRVVDPRSLANFFLSRSSVTPIVGRLGLEETRRRLIDIISSYSGSEALCIPVDCEVITARAML
ncbi:MAG: class I SAM-dependent methyltransferase [Hyphomicrobiaceae bacterium]